MTHGSLLFIRTLAHGMELCWLSAWAVYTTALTASPRFPLAEAIFAFVGASLLTRLSTGRGWLVLTVLGTQAAGLLLAAVGFLHALSGRTAWLVERACLATLLTAPRPPVEWLRLGLELAWLLGYWLGGVTLARRPVEYGPLCARFDVGLGLFFGLFLIRWTADANGGIANDPLSPTFVLPFLISGLTAIGAIRLWGDGQTGFLPGYRGIGVFLLFAVAALLVTAASASFLLPVLTLAAEAGLVALQGAATLLSPVFLWLLRLLFAPHALRTDPAPPPSTREVADALPPPLRHGWWLDLVERILAWAAAAVVILAGLLLLGLAAYALWRLLVTRTAMAPREGADRNRIRLALAWLRRLRMALSRGRCGRRQAGEFYAALLGWARRGGHPRTPTETPAEFAGRLRRRFPRLAPEIGLIVEAFHREVYGEISLDEERRAAVAAAWRHLRSPRHWPVRLREWFRG